MSVAVSYTLPKIPPMPDPDRKRLMAAVGGHVARELQRYFRNRGGTFWPSIGNATALHSVTSSIAVVSVSPPEGYKLAHKIKGGPIQARPPRKRIAIPVNARARSLGWPSHWSKPGDGKLVGAYGRSGLYGLTLGRNGPLMYILVKKTKPQKPDPKALPAMRSIAMLISDEVSWWLDDYKKRIMRS